MLIAFVDAYAHKQKGTMTACFANLANQTSIASILDGNTNLFQHVHLGILKITGGFHPRASFFSSSSQEVHHGF
jgi:hypothetical protein